MPDDTDIYKTPSYHCPDRQGVREFAIYLSENESELPVDANVDLPFLVPVASKRAFGVGIEVGAVIGAVCTAESGFVPGAAVVTGKVHGFTVRGREVEAAVTAEFVEDRDFEVVVIGAGRIGTALTEDEAQTANAAVVAVHMDFFAAARREVFVVQAPCDQLGLRFDEQTMAVQFQRPAVFDTQAFAVCAEVGIVGIGAIGMKVGIVTAPFGDDVCIGSGIAEPGAVDSTGQRMVLAAAVVIAWGSDAPFAEEAIDALIVGSIIVADLDGVVFAVVMRAVDVSTIRPGPDTGGITLVLEKTQVTHALAQGVDGIAIQTVAVINGAEERLRVRIDGFGQFGQVPFRIPGISHAHGIAYIAAVLDGGGHIPQAALVNRLTAEGGILAVIRNEEQMLCVRYFIARQETPIIDPDKTMRAFLSTIHVHLVTVGLAGKIRLHLEDAILAAVLVHVQPLVRRAVLHVYGAPVIQGQPRHLAAARHVPPGPICQSQFRAGRGGIHGKSGITGCISSGYRHKPMGSWVNG